MVLSASGKTKKIMYVSLTTFVVKLAITILLYFAVGLIGPAIATLIITVIQGLWILSLSAKELQTTLFKMFDFKYFALFLLELSLVSCVSLILRRLLLSLNLGYFFVMAIVYMFFLVSMVALNYKRLFKDLETINSFK